MEEYTQLIVINVSTKHAHKSEIHKKVEECEKDRAIGMYGEEMESIFQDEDACE